jgi:hypothetical protein
MIVEFIWTLFSKSLAVGIGFMYMFFLVSVVGCQPHVRVIILACIAAIAKQVMLLFFYFYCTSSFMVDVYI